MVFSFLTIEREVSQILSSRNVATSQRETNVVMEKNAELFLLKLRNFISV